MKDFIEKFKKEQNRTETKSIQLTVDGEEGVRRKSQVRKDKRLFEIVRACDHSNINKTLDDLVLVLSAVDEN